MLSVIFAQNNIGPWGGATATGVEGMIQPFKTLRFNFLTNYFANIKFEQVRLLRSNQFVIWPYLHSRPGKQIVHLVLTGKSQTLDQQGDRKYTLFLSKTESVESSYV